MRHFSKIVLAEKKAEEYEKIQPEVCADLREIAGKVGGKRILHINSSGNGGGVAELLRSQIPFERSLGLESDWYVMDPPKDFFVITKKIHNLLQGESGRLSQKEKSYYMSVNGAMENELKNILAEAGSGTVIIHDPQPLPLIHFIPKNFSTILRLHVDLQSPNPEMMEFLRPHILKYGKVIISSKDYARSMPWLDKERLEIIYPAIDPLSKKNKPMTKEEAREILKTLPINFSKPLVTQVSRFDPWKDPLGVIRAYYIAKNKIPGLQLALAGSFADDDPEGQHIYEKIKKIVHGDNDIYLFSNAKESIASPTDDFISALYTISDVVLQKSLREGFGLTITEAMWKKKPIIAGMASGPRLQIKNKKNGILVSSPEEAGSAIVELIGNRKLGEKLGKAAHDSVLNSFLLPNYVLNNLKLYS